MQFGAKLGTLVFVFLSICFGLASVSFAQSSATETLLNTPTKKNAPARTTAQNPGAETTIAQNSPPKNAVAKKIVVTGSYIRRNADEGAPSPVSTIDNSKAQEAATYSAGGLMADNAIISSGTSSNVAFHGQSSANNLVLLNGLRIPKPGGGDSSSIDFVPASAIERVEILKDGASALYGSEALAGVVNIITKKEYDGANISLRHTRPERFIGESTASESNLSATYGKSFEKGNILAVFQYRGNKPVMNNQTEYGIENVVLRGSDVSNPGNLQKTNSPRANYHAADCPADLVDSRNLCRYNFYDTLQIGSNRHYYNALLSSGFDLGDGLRIENTFLYNRTEGNSLNTPVIMRFQDQSAAGGANLSIPGTVASGWASDLIAPGGGTPTINPGDNFNLLYSPDQELGARQTSNTLDAGAFQMSLGKESDDLDWNFSIGYSANYATDTMVSGNAQTSAVYNKLLTTWNPFADTDTKDVNALADTRIQTWNTSFSDVLNSRFILSGKEFDLGPKSIYAAVGIEHQLQSYRFRVDDFSLQNDALTGSGTNQDGHRNLISSFIELTQNPIPDLQLQLAGRFDSYSDFGTTINPKIAAAYKVSETAMIRTSYGTGFKAPDLRSLYQGNLSRPQRIRDEVSCVNKGPNDPNCNTLVATTSRGDANLGPENGEHINIGMQFRPKKNWQINIDHWRASGTQQLSDIGSGDLSRLTQVEQQFGASALDSLGVIIVRDADGIIQSFSYPVRVNSGRYRLNGIDFDLKYKNQINPFGLGTMNFSFKFDHSHLLRREAQVFDILTAQYNFDLNWKNITSFSLSKGKHLGSWRMRTFSGGDKDTSQTASNIGIGSIPTITEHDLHYEYYGAWDGVISAGVRNVFDSIFYNEYNRGQNGFLLPASPTSLGRTFYVGYSQDF